MNTTKHERPGAVAGQVDCRVRPLVERLRCNADSWLPTSDHTLEAHNLLTAGADELERLHAMLADCKSGLVQALNACNPKAPEKLQQRCIEQVADLLGRLDDVLRPNDEAKRRP